MARAVVVFLRLVQPCWTLEGPGLFQGWGTGGVCASNDVVDFTYVGRSDLKSRECVFIRGLRVFFLTWLVLTMRVCWL